MEKLPFILWCCHLVVDGRSRRSSVVVLMLFSSLQCNVNAESGEPEDELTPEAVAFCRRVGSNATRVSEIAGGLDRAINAAIQEGINAVNQKSASNAQRIQKWTILGRDFSITSGELGELAVVFPSSQFWTQTQANTGYWCCTGPTMKLKRPAVLKIHKEEIEEFYKEVATPLTPEDPRPPQ